MKYIYCIFFRAFPTRYFFHCSISIMTGKNYPVPPPPYPNNNYIRKKKYNILMRVRLYIKIKLSAICVIAINQQRDM